MPRGSRPGERRGGRAKGVPNKKTVVQQVVDRARHRADSPVAISLGGKVPLPKDRLGELLNVALGVMQANMPVTKDMVEAAAAQGRVMQERTGNPAAFGEWFDRAAYVAKELAKYFHPQMRSIQLPAPPPEDKQGGRRRFTLAVFEDGRQVPPMLTLKDGEMVDDDEE